MQATTQRPSGEPELTPSPSIAFLKSSLFGHTAYHHLTSPVSPPPHPNGSLPSSRRALTPTHPPNPPPSLPSQRSSPPLHLHNPKAALPHPLSPQPQSSHKPYPNLHASWTSCCGPACNPIPARLLRAPRQPSWAPCPATGSAPVLPWRQRHGPWPWRPLRSRRACCVGSGAGGSCPSAPTRWRS